MWKQASGSGGAVSGGTSGISGVGVAISSLDEAGGAGKRDVLGQSLGSIEAGAVQGLVQGLAPGMAPSMVSGSEMGASAEMGGGSGMGGSVGAGYGILNVQARVKLSFGEPYGVQIASEYGKGTIVTIRHPIIEGSTQGGDGYESDMEGDHRR